MTSSNARFSAFIAAAALFAAGCGSNSSDSTTTTAESPAAGAATTDSGKKAAAPIPSDLHCTDAIVWVNLASKAYHMSGDKFYGRSKRGEYECQSTADAKGYHLAGTAKNHTGTQTSEPSPSST